MPKPKLLRPKRANPTASFPNLDLIIADKARALRQCLVIVSAIQNGWCGEDLAALVERVKPVVGHDAIPRYPNANKSSASRPRVTYIGESDHHPAGNFSLKFNGQTALALRAGGSRQGCSVTLSWQCANAKTRQLGPRSKIRNGSVLVGRDIRPHQSSDPDFGDRNPGELAQSSRRAAASA